MFIVGKYELLSSLGPIIVSQLSDVREARGRRRRTGWGGGEGDMGRRKGGG